MNIPIAVHEVQELERTKSLTFVRLNLDVDSSRPLFLVEGGRSHLVRVKDCKKLEVDHSSDVVVVLSVELVSDRLPCFTSIPNTRSCQGMQHPSRGNADREEQCGYCCSWTGEMARSTEFKVQNQDGFVSSDNFRNFRQAAELARNTGGCVLGVTSIRYSKQANDLPLGPGDLKSLDHISEYQRTYLGWDRMDEKQDSYDESVRKGLEKIVQHYEKRDIDAINVVALLDELQRLLKLV